MTQRLFKWVDLVWMQINSWEITKITKLKTMKMMEKFSIERRLKKIKKNQNKVQLICKISWLKYPSKTLKHQTITKTVKSRIYTDSISTIHFKPCMLSKITSLWYLLKPFRTSWSIYRILWVQVTKNCSFLIWTRHLSTALTILKLRIPTWSSRLISLARNPYVQVSI